MRASDLTLLNCSYTINDYGQQIKIDTQEVIPVIEMSITRTEWSNAIRAGHNPDIALQTAAINYSGQTEAIYEGERYSIYRTYAKGDYIELYLEKKVGI